MLASSAYALARSPRIIIQKITLKYDVHREKKNKFVLQQCSSMSLSPLTSGGKEVASWEGNRYRKERGRREARLFLRMVIGGSKNKLPQTGQDRRQHREDKIKYLDFFLRTKQKV